MAPVPAWDLISEISLESPSELPERARAQLSEAWQGLQAGNLAAAAPPLEALSERYPDTAEVLAARGFLELRQGRVPAAEDYFRKALVDEPRQEAAQSGSVLSALTAEDTELAFNRVSRLAETKPSSPLVARFLPTLQLEIAEARLSRARELSAEERHEDAATEYGRALEAVPESGGLYLEAAESALAAGLLDDAVERARRATELQPGDAVGFEVLGRAHEANGDVTSAYEAYSAAVELRPRDDRLAAKLRALQARYDQQNLPPEYSEIGDSTRLTREQLAALLFVELRPLFDDAPAGQRSIAIDIADSWASRFISEALALGVMHVEPNHTFRPQAFVNRADLAGCLATAFERFAPDAYREAMSSPEIDPAFVDLSSDNVSYEAAAVAVGLGWLEAGDEGAFDPQRLVSGAEAVDAVAALSADMTR